MAVGIFDSGLTVWDAVRTRLPDLPLVLWTTTRMRLTGCATCYIFTKIGIKHRASSP